jgi:hypothetical protein
VDAAAAFTRRGALVQVLPIVMAVPLSGLVAQGFAARLLIALAAAVVLGFLGGLADPWLARRAPGLPGQVIVAVTGDEVHVLERGFVRGARRIETWPAGTFTASWRHSALRLKLTVRLDDGRPRELTSIALQIGRTAKARNVVERIAALAHPEQGRLKPGGARVDLVQCRCR